MSKTDYIWNKEAPPKPDVYTTRRNESKYLTLRYWDGEHWYEIAWTGSRGGTPFKWPAKSFTKRPRWAVNYKEHLRLRKISAYLGDIQWGNPYTVFSEKEVINFLVQTGRLPFEWRTAFQEEMRAAA